MLPSLPYDYSDLYDDAQDERVKGVFCNDVGFIRIVGDEQSGGRDEEYHECEDEWCSWICFEVAFQSDEIRLPSLLSAEFPLNDKASLALNLLVIHVEG
jgi:hypothetical protein